MQLIKTDKGNGSVIYESDEKQSSIEVSKNAKGDVAWKVKVYEDKKDKCETKLEEFVGIAEQTTILIKAGKIDTE